MTGRRTGWFIRICSRQLGRGQPPGLPSFPERLVRELRARARRVRAGKNGTPARWGPAASARLTRRKEGVPPSHPAHPVWADDLSGPLRYSENARRRWASPPCRERSEAQRCFFNAADYLSIWADAQLAGAHIEHPSHNSEGRIERRKTSGWGVMLIGDVDVHSFRRRTTTTLSDVDYKQTEKKGRPGAGFIRRGQRPSGMAPATGRSGDRPLRRRPSQGAPRAGLQPARPKRPPRSELAVMELPAQNRPAGSVRTDRRSRPYRRSSPNSRCRSCRLASGTADARASCKRKTTAARRGGRPPAKKFAVACPETAGPETKKPARGRFGCRHPRDSDGLSLKFSFGHPRRPAGRFPPLPTPGSGWLFDFP